MTVHGLPTALVNLTIVWALWARRKNKKQKKLNNTIEHIRRYNNTASDNMIYIVGTARRGFDRQETVDDSLVSLGRPQKPWPWLLQSYVYARTVIPLACYSNIRIVSVDIRIASWRVTGLIFVSWLFQRLLHIVHARTRVHAHSYTRMPSSF